MFARYGIALGVGVAMTFGLLLIMQLLIASDRSAAGPAGERHSLDMVRVERTRLIERTRRPPEKPPEPQRPPEMPTPSFTHPNTPLAVTFTAPIFDPGARVGREGFRVSDGDYLSLVKVTPTYPPRAAQRELEGYVVVEFTITRSGDTRDVRVVESTDPVFHNAAVEAASKFRYKPRSIDGEAVEVAGVRNRITFVLER